MLNACLSLTHLYVFRLCNSQTCVITFTGSFGLLEVALFITIKIELRIGILPMFFIRSNDAFYKPREENIRENMK